MVNSWEYGVRGRKKSRLCLDVRHRWMVMTLIQTKVLGWEMVDSVLGMLGTKSLKCSSVPRGLFEEVSLSHEPLLASKFIKNSWIPHRYYTVKYPISGKMEKITDNKLKTQDDVYRLNTSF